jgi:hypothetical protein
MATTSGRMMACGTVRRFGDIVGACGWRRPSGRAQSFRASMISGQVGNGGMPRRWRRHRSRP